MTYPQNNCPTPNSSTALAAALDLATQGYACFPCRSDKTPACPHGFKNASADVVDLKDLWVHCPGPLVGVATGPASMIAVLDIDSKHDSAKQWWEEHRDRLPATRTHRTRSGGLHLIYGDCDRLKCSISKIAKGVDVRADGGYIIWWPAAGFPVLSDAPCAPWPQWLDPSPPADQLPPPRPPSRRMIADPSYIEARIEGLLRFVFAASEGERNARVYWAACKIRDMVMAGELDSVTGDQAFEELRQIGIHVGLNNNEIIKTIKSAAFARNPR